MGDLPYPPKLKLTPHQRALLAGELYPPDEPSEQPLRLDEETRQRNLQGIEDARAALHRVTEHNIPVPQKPEYVDEREHVTGQRTGRKVLKNPPAYEKPPPPPPPPPPKQEKGSAASGETPYEEGTEGQDFRRSRGYLYRKVRAEKRQREQDDALAEEEMRLGKEAIDDLPPNPTFDEVEQKLLAESQEEDSIVWRVGNANPGLIPIEGLEEFYDEGVAGQWFYDVKSSPVDYFKAGTHGQGMGPIYSNYGSSGFAAPAVTTPKRAGPPPPGATSSRPVEDKPPTLSSRSYFSEGTQ